MAALALLLAAGAAGAGVRLEVLPDGSMVMRGEGSSSSSTSRPAAAPPRAAAPTRELDLTIDDAARRLEVDPELVRAVIQVESGYDPRALSHKGAMGLMQLMPGTAAQLAVRDPWDPRQNVRGGVAYLRDMLERFDGHTELALAGYNAGPEAVRRYGGVPPYPETRSYVEKVLRLYRRDPDYRLEGGGHAPAASPVRLYRDAKGRLVISNQRPADR